MTNFVSPFYKINTLSQKGGGGGGGGGIVLQW